MTIFNEDKEKYAIEKIWDETFSNGFNVLSTKKIFRDSEESLVFGCFNGDVKVHKAVYSTQEEIVAFEKDGKSYETKGGPINSLVTSNVTKFSSEDVIVGDSKGLLTILTNGQILKRTQICDSKINAITLDVDSVGNQSIIVGSNDGTIVACTPYNSLWKCRLYEVLKENERSSDISICITAMHVFRMQSATMDVSYLMVADSQKRIHFFQNGTLVKTLHVPSVVTSFCSGCFLNNEDNEQKNVSSPSKSQRISSEDQVAMATKSGAIFIFSNFVVVPYSNLLYPVTYIKQLPATGSDNLDALICCGHFNKMCILQNKKLVTSYETKDWVHSIDILEKRSNSDSFSLVVGSLDNTVNILRLRRNR
ncbi:uncharacterized protein [Clytia hemisphaerica]|uniref:Uncharacterized protein n=1 Tax=Clytia hemisphaerica TaxID=252671 RepID=A0A7M5X1W6_9CNID